MALNSRNPVDPRWLTHNQAVVRGLQLAQIEIYNPSDSTQTYDPVTNAWTGDATEVYTGRARVQSLTSVNLTGEGYNKTEIKTVRVQISYNKNTLEGATEAMPDIRPNYKMRVTSSPYNETLTKFIFIVTDVLNSSNSWERTLLCKVDTELDPTNA